MTERQTAAPRDFLPPSVLARIDAPVAVLVILLAPVIGSVASGLIILIAIIGWFRLVPLVGSMTVPKAVVWTSAAFVAFFVAEAVAGLVNWRGTPTLVEAGENAIFLGMLPWFMLFSSKRADLLKFVLMAAPWCAFAALSMALFQDLVLDYRPKGGAGNAAVFAVVVAVLLAFNLITLMRHASRGQAILAVAGVLASAATLILSETRSLWPCLFLFPVLIWLATRRSSIAPLRPALFALAAILVIAVAFGGTIRDRYEQAMADIAATQSGQYQTSIGKRLVIWNVAVDAIFERPIFGHGPDSPAGLMAERTPQVSGTPVIYTHFHNVVLNEMVRAGIVGTLALAAMFVVPLGFALAAGRDETASVGLALLVCFQAAFLLSGTVGIMFDHDVTDTQFTVLTAFCLYLLFPREEEAR